MVLRSGRAVARRRDHSSWRAHTGHRRFARAVRSRTGHLSTCSVVPAFGPSRASPPPRNLRRRLPDDLLLPTLHHHDRLSPDRPSHPRRRRLRLQAPAMDPFDVTPRASRREVLRRVRPAVSAELEVMERDVMALADGARTLMAIALQDLLPLVVPGLEERPPRQPQTRARERHERHERRARARASAKLRFDRPPVTQEIEGDAKLEQADRLIRRRLGQEADGHLRAQPAQAEQRAKDLTPLHLALVSNAPRRAGTWPRRRPSVTRCSSEESDRPIRSRA